MAGAAALLLVGAGAYLALRSRPPKLTSATPLRVRPGQTLTLHGENFALPASENEVRFDGRPGRILGAAADALQVEVPAAITTAPGQDTPVSVTVRSRGRDSEPFELSAYRAPVIKSLMPDVAMPGDEVVIAGTGWGAKAQISFGPVAAELVESTPEALRVKVPGLEGAPGTPFPVVVADGSERSEPAAFLLGRLPLVTGVAPASAVPGDVVTLTGRGFAPRAGDNSVLVGGQPALVVSAGDAELKAVVPLLPAGAGGVTAIELRVPGSTVECTSQIALGGPAETATFRFVAEPFGGAGQRAVLATELGPVFVLSAAGGRSAAERALEAQRRLNESAGMLAGAEGVELEIRDAGAEVVIGLRGKEQPLLEVSDADAEAYDQNAEGFRGNAGRRVTRRRLAVWWLALTRDLASLLASGARPRHVALLTPEGRALAELHEAARGLTGAGVPRKALAGLRPDSRKALQALALHVPPAVGDSEGAPNASAAGAAAEDPLQLEGQWSGTATEEGVMKPVRVDFTSSGGTLTYLKPLQVTVPIHEVLRPRLGSVRFAIRIGGGTRYFLGSWDGEALGGSIASTPDSQSVIGRFELRR